MMNTILLLALLIFIITLILHLKIRKPKHGNKLNPPGPPALPIIGNLHQFDGRSPHTYLHRLSRKYGPIMSLKLGFRRVVVVSSADVVKEIMRSHDVVFSSRPSLVSLRRLSYNGLSVTFTPYGDVWKEMRKISTVHLFSTKQLESFLPIFKDEISKMIEKIAIDAVSSSITNLSEMMMSFSSNTICRVVFGGEGTRHFSDVFGESQSVLGGFFVEDYLPWLRFIDWFSGMRARLEKNFHERDAFCEELIQQHMNPKSMEGEGDFVDFLLQTRRNGSSSIHLTFDHIKSLLVDIITGGRDTTSSALVWALASLMKNPSSMKKVQAEIRQLAGKKDLIDEQDIDKLPYLRAVIKETLRLYPPTPLSVPRETTDTCSINSYEIEAGTMVYINSWAIARDPTNWENANEFMPERFLECEIDVKGQNPEVIPFGIGRRICPGMRMGMVGFELALANVLYKFEWALPHGVKEEDLDFEALPGIAIHKKIALCLVAKPVE